MAPPKMQKKVIEKPVIERTISKSKKKKNFSNFSKFLFRVLRTVTQDKFGISRASMMIMNNFVHDMLEKIATEASRLVVHGKKTTLGSREIQSSIKILVPGELGKHTNIEGLKAMSLYHSHLNKESK